MKKNMKNRRAFSMIELIFVIVILGILAGVAVPKMMGTRTDAYISKAKSQIASIKNGINTNAATNMLSGGCSNRYPVDLNNTAITIASGQTLFDNVLKEAIISSNGDGGWILKALTLVDKAISPEIFIFKIETGRTVDFTYDDTNGLFSCDVDDITTGDDCLILTK